jgi:hypothetical protein
MKNNDKSLFNKSFLQKKLNDYKVEVQNHSSIFRKYDETNKKEESIKADFLNDIFGKILGYEIDISNLEYNLDKEYKTDITAKQVDGVLGFITKDKKDVRVIIEIKGYNTKHLESIEEQAFGYRNKIEGIEWVITSNFREFRLYSSYSGQVKYYSWSLKELSESIEKQKEFYFLLAKDRLFTSQTLNSPTHQLLDENKELEETITQKFYSEYKNIRIKLFTHLSEQNLHKEPTILLSKAQKILDRIIFICFCQNFTLLPDKSLQNVVDNAKYSYEDTTIWKQLKGLFKAINEGWPKKDINKFNGGLFANDIELDELILQDNIFTEVINISKWDFSSDLSVNILGHIFEQSITDLEEIKANITNNLYNKKQGKQKRDGVFYTPDYITQYIVEQAVGGWLNEQKEALGINELTPQEISNEKNKKNKKTINPNQELINRYKLYAEKLKQIKVLDPSCGSGAFLIAVFNYLEKEWIILSEKLRELGDENETTFFAYDRNYKDILKNNIYGVDINPESVQITKLSLWLKTAKKTEELITLDNNIKCGNSLIDDASIETGFYINNNGKQVSLAFNWQQEFSNVFANGGFDVIVGNPPYVGQKGNSLLFSSFKELYPQFYERKQDLYYYFIYKSFLLLINNGYISFIIPPYFLTATSAKNLRKEILKNQIKSILEIKAKVFNTASIHSLIFLFKKYHPSNNMFNIYQLKPTKEENILINKYDQNKLTQDNWYILGGDADIDIKIDYQNLGDIAKITPGIQSGLDKAYVITKEKLSQFNEEERKFIKKFYKNSHIQRYNIKNNEQYIIITNEIDSISKYPNIEKHLIRFKNDLDKRFRNFTLKNADKHEKWWFMFGYRPNTNFEGSKILIPYRSSQNNFVVSTSEFYASIDVFYIDILIEDFNLYYLNSILSSKVIYYYLLKHCKMKGQVFEFYQEPLKKLPIPKISEEEQKPFVEKAQQMLALNKQLYEIINDMLKIVQVDLGVSKITKNLEKWHKLTTTEFFNEVAKQNKQLSIDKKSKWIQYFEEQKAKANSLQNQITATDNEIDAMVYKLYELTEEEIKTIEEAI